MSALHPTPYTPHPTPYTLHPTPCSLHPTPHTPHPRQARGILACRHSGSAGGRGSTPQLEVLVLTDYELQKWIYTLGAGAEMQVGEGSHPILYKNAFDLKLSGSELYCTA